MNSCNKGCKAMNLDDRLVHLDTKKEKQYTYTKRKKGFIYSIQYITYIYIYLIKQQ